MDTGPVDRAGSPICTKSEFRGMGHEKLTQLAQALPVLLRFRWMTGASSSSGAKSRCFESMRALAPNGYLRKENGASELEEVSSRFARLRLPWVELGSIIGEAPLGQPIRSLEQ